METTRVKRMSLEEVQDRLDEGEELVFIDARSPRSWDQSDIKIPGAIRIPPDETSEHIEELPRDRTLITYCT